MVYQWHQEGFDLPHGSRLIAQGATFPHQAFCYNQRAYGLQFHPEMTTLMMNFWTTYGAEQLVYPRCSKSLVSAESAPVVSRSS